MRKLILIAIVFVFASSLSNAQFLDKLKKQAQKTVETVKSGTSKDSTKSSSTGTGQGSSSSSGGSVLKQIGDAVGSVGGIGSGGKSILSTEDAVKGLKEALTKGVSNGTDVLSKADGFLKNPEVKIPFPQDAQKVESTLRKVGLSKQVDDVVTSLNRAAEDAAGSAKDIFVSAVKDMTFEDALKIVKGDSIAATNYLKSKTTEKLTAQFAPIIKNSLDKVNATKYWKTAMTSYNKIPLVSKINPDLNQYVTAKAIDALFLMIGKEESLIRKDPLKQTTEILKKVFGK